MWGGGDKGKRGGGGGVIGNRGRGGRNKKSWGEVEKK